MRKIFEQLKKDESGASLIEYVLIASVVSIAGLATMQALGGGRDLWAIDTAIGGTDP